MASLTSLDGEVEAGQILVGREAGRLDLIGDGPDLAFGDLGLEQLGEDRNRRVRRPGAPCSISSLAAWAMPYIFSERSITTMAPLAGS